MGFVSKEIIANTNAQMIENATLYDFGILSSNVHMAWMRAICGRMKSDYAYSGSIVYNSFPWPEYDDKNSKKIEITAKKILSVRLQYKDFTLADLYDDLIMPIELRNAHRENNKAVMKAYGFSTKMTEEECVIELMKLYKKKIKENP